MMQADDNEILTFLEAQGMIDRAHILQQIEMAKKKEILAKHSQKIWQGTNGLWYTHLYDIEGKRRLIKKKTREAVEDAIIEAYESEPIVREVFEAWIAEKVEYGEAQKSTLDRYSADYRRYFGGTKLDRKEISAVTELELEDFIKDRIKEFNLTSKAYGGLRTIIIGTFSYARKHKYSNIAINTFFAELGLSKKIFKHKTQLPQDNVFTKEETDRLIRHFSNVRTNVISLGIILAFRTGLRVGELCVLTPDDIQDHYINITKTEVRYKVADGKYVHEVRDNAKTEAGNRCVLIDDEAMRLIDEIKEYNPSGKYLFEIGGKRCIGQSFTRKLERACNTLGIKKRSMHKCRKTYATALINGNVPESLVISQMGHVDISTTRRFYLFDNTQKDEAIKRVTEALA